MKKLFIIKLSVTLVSLVLSLLIPFTPVNASVNASLQTQDANALVKLGILKGDAKGNLRLNDKIKRAEFIALVVRMCGYDKNTDISDVNISFKDLSKKHWAYDSIRIALKQGLITGYPDNTIAPDAYVTCSQAQTVLIRALGYESKLEGEWPDSVVKKSTELELDKNVSISPSAQITRGEMAILVYNTLVVPLIK